MNIDRSDAQPAEIELIRGCRLHGDDELSLFDVELKDGKISNIGQHKDPEEHTSIDAEPRVLDAGSRLLLPSLCHAHIHLDKCFILQDEKFKDYQIKDGGFAEAMELTGEAKSYFNGEDLIRRGRRLIEESVAAGVTAMRVFVEVDEIVEMRGIEAAIVLRREFTNLCFIRICAYAQLALFEPNDVGRIRRDLLTQALDIHEVEAIGSTPYVEQDRDASKENVRWTIDQALSGHKHLDFHLDYNLDDGINPLTGYVVQALLQARWPTKSIQPPELLINVSLGHCTRLALISDDEWTRLAQLIQSNDLPVSFVGLPTSDLYMMGRPQDDTQHAIDRPRGTLQVPNLIEQYGLNCAMSINNVGNAFTPHGSCDPLQLASLGMLVYQAATTQNCKTLYEAVSTRAKTAMGLRHRSLSLEVGDIADLVLYGSVGHDRLPPSVARVVYDAEHDRIVLHEGRLVAERTTFARLHGT